MKLESHVEIDFHQQDEASVFIKNTAGGSEEQAGEILLFTCFTLRQLVNFGNGDPIASSLADYLIQVQDNLKNLINYTGPDEPRTY